MSRCFPMIRNTALALLAAASTVAPAAANVYLPTTSAELREAVTAANQSPGFDAIVLGAGTYAVAGASGEDLNASGDLDILDDLAIVGAGADRTILQGASDRVLDIHAGATVEITGVTIRNGKLQASGDGAGVRNTGELTLTRVHVTGNQANGGAGGGIHSSGNNSSLTIAQSAITGNTAGSVGGGIALDGAMTLTDSTISGNSAGSVGGGLYTFDNSDAVIVNVTITANQAANHSGGLFAEVTPFLTTDRPVLSNTILAGNTAPTDRDCGGGPASAGHNLVGVGGTCIGFTATGDLVGTVATPRDAKLGPLVNNGGTTPTHALLAGSPALGAGGDCTDADQRGQDRLGIPCDIGAFELGAECLTGGPNLCLNGGRFRVTVSFRTNNGQTGSGQAVALTPDTGYFWFFDPNNVEVTVKVLNGCGFNQRFWAFLAGMTNVEVTMTVTDTATGQTKTYTNPQGRTFRTILDTNAFTSCGATP
jgi:hypothetical protein